jgi:O-antigen ligase
MGRASHIALVAMALLAGLFEGPAEIAAVIAVGLLLAGGAWRDARLNVADLGVGLWLVAGAIGLIGSPAVLGSAPTLHPLIALAYVAGRLGIARADDTLLRRLGLAFAVACVINGLYGIFQVAFFDPPLESVIIGRSAAARLADPEASGRLRMATGLFYNRLKFAHVAVLGLGLIGLAIDGAIQERRTRGQIARAFGAAVALGLALFLTYRRAAPAALLGAGLLLALLMRRLRLAASVVAIAGGILLLYFLTDYGRDRIDAAALELGERLQIYQAALTLVMEHPLVGVGHGGWAGSIGAYLPPDLSAKVLRNGLNSPHNLGLQVMAETGVLGFLGFAAAVGSSLAATALAIRRDRDVQSPQATLDRFVFLGLVALIGLGMLHSVLYHVPVALAFWTMLGVASARLET